LDEKRCIWEIGDASYGSISGLNPKVFILHSNQTMLTVMEDENAISRRSFLQRMSLLGAVSIGTGSMLSACGGGSENADADGGDMDGGETDAAASADFSCTDTSGLTEQELATRENLGYVDESPDPEKLCSNCQFYQPAGEGECGGCTLIKGPIHPDGYCNSWVAKQAATG